MTTIRDAGPEDAGDIRKIARSTGMFSDEEQAFIDEMISDDLGQYGGERQWFLSSVNGVPAGAGCLGTEAFQPDVQNLFFLGVLPERRRAGQATALIAESRRRAQAAGARVLLIETSSSAQFDPARRLYRQLGFSEDGRIRGYYAPDQDKVIFRLTL